MRAKSGPRRPAGCPPVLEQQPLEQVERSHVARILEAPSWHKGQACEILGVSRPRLRRMIRQYGLEPPEPLSAKYGEEEL